MISLKKNVARRCLVYLLVDLSFARVAVRVLGRPAGHRLARSRRCGWLRSGLEAARRQPVDCRQACPALTATVLTWPECKKKKRERIEQYMLVCQLKTTNPVRSNPTQLIHHWAPCISLVCCAPRACDGPTGRVGPRALAGRDDDVPVGSTHTQLRIKKSANHSKTNFGSVRLSIRLISIHIDCWFISYAVLLILMYFYKKMSIKLFF